MTSATQHFHHRTTGTGCDCPIHRGRAREPFTAPLGYPFAGDVHVRPITRERAGEIYAAHHSYMMAVPTINLVHHGLYYQSALVGAITYRYPLLHKKAIRYDATGQVLPESIDIDEDLPETLQPTARRILREVTPEEVAERRIVTGDRVIEAARICLGVRMPNLASAALARSMDRFAREQAPADAEDVDYLVTFVRADYDGAMIRALRDKGWVCTGVREPGQAGNREPKPIRERYKWRFCCDLREYEQNRQTALGRWSE